MNEAESFTDILARYHLYMVVFNAVSIEHTLARFFGDTIGDRGTFYDADVFRGGRPKDLALVVRRVADALEERIALIEFPAHGNGTAKAHLDFSIYQLRDLSDQIEQRKKPERENYHWEVFGALMAAIVGLLETLEAQIPGAIH